MKFLKKLALTAACLLLAAASADACPHRRQARQQAREDRRPCATQAPVEAPPTYQAAPPQSVVMPATGYVVLPSRPVIHGVQPFGQCFNGVCPR